MYAHCANEVRAAMPIEEQIKTLLDAFDFELCRQVMVMLGWRWGINETPPSVEELRADAELHLRRVAEMDPSEPFVMTSSGGIVAHRIRGALDLGFGFSARKNMFPFNMMDSFVEWCAKNGNYIPNWVI